MQRDTREFCRSVQFTHSKPPMQRDTASLPFLTTSPAFKAACAAGNFHVVFKNSAGDIQSRLCGGEP